VNNTRAHASAFDFIWWGCFPFFFAMGSSFKYGSSFGAVARTFNFATYPVLGLICYLTYFVKKSLLINPSNWPPEPIGIEGTIKIADVSTLRQIFPGPSRTT
jgi:hypothetical protein